MIIQDKQTGLSFFDSLDGNTLIIEADKIPLCLKFAKDKNIDRFAIDRYFSGPNLDFLQQVPFIKHISIPEGNFNIEGIYKLSQLSSMMISGFNREINFRFFPNLIKLIADWSPNFASFDDCTALNSLTFYGYRPKSKDMTALPNLMNLTALMIVQSPINSMSGLERFTKLKSLELYYCSKLQQISALSVDAGTMENLCFDHCKSLKNHGYVANIRGLTSLRFNSCGEIPNLKFIRELRMLENFRFIDTNIVDGDLTPCIGLKSVGFSNKRHYSHTNQQLLSLSPPPR